MAAMKIVPRRPTAWLMGSDIHAALRHYVNLLFVRDKYKVTYNRAMAMYGDELTNPTSQEFLLH